MADLDLTEREVRCQVLNQFRFLTVEIKHATMIKKALLPRQVCAFWIFPQSHFEKYENKMQTKKVQTGFVSFTTACILSCSSIIVSDQFCLWYCHWGYALHTNSKLSWARICYRENVCDLQPFSTIFLQQRSVSVKALGVGHQWL